MPGCWNITATDDQSPYAEELEFSDPVGDDGQVLNSNNHSYFLFLLTNIPSPHLELRLEYLNFILT